MDKGKMSELIIGIVSLLLVILIIGYAMNFLSEIKDSLSNTEDKKEETGDGSGEPSPDPDLGGGTFGVLQKLSKDDVEFYIAQGEGHYYIEIAVELKALTHYNFRWQLDRDKFIAELDKSNLSLIEKENACTILFFDNTRDEDVGYDASFEYTSYTAMISNGANFNTGLQSGTKYFRFFMLDNITDSDDEGDSTDEEALEYLKYFAENILLSFDVEQRWLNEAEQKALSPAK